MQQDLAVRFFNQPLGGADSQVSYLATTYFTVTATNTHLREHFVVLQSSRPA